MLYYINIYSVASGALLPITDMGPKELLKAVTFQAFAPMEFMFHGVSTQPKVQLQRACW